MRKYYYKALNLSGKKIKGIYACDSLEKLNMDLRKNEFFIIDFKEVKDVNFKMRTKLSLKQCCMFCRQFHQLLSVGISMVQTLGILYLQCENKFQKDVLKSLKECVESGKSLSYSMRYFKNVYPEFLIVMVKIGEQTGNLDEIFNGLYNHYYYKYELKSKIKKNLMYPLITLSAVVIVTVFLKFKIIPIFMSSLLSMGGKIPVVTKCFMFMLNNGFVFSALILVSIYVIVFAFKNSKYTEKIKYNLPFLKNALLKWEEIKFIQKFSILMRSGINLIRVFDIIVDTTESVFIKSKLKEIPKEIKKGASISQALTKVDIFQPFVISMISTGEISGKLDITLKNIEDILNNEFKYTLESIVEILEPLFIVIASIFVGFVVISMIMPIINMTTSITL